MNVFKRKVGIAIIAGLLGTGAMSAQSAFPLYYSQTSGQKSQMNGTQSKTTDKYESGSFSLSTQGPIQVAVTPSDLSIGINSSKTWNGIVTPNSLAPGTSQNAKVIASYDVNYSRPAGGSGGGNVVSTYTCGESGTSDGCPHHGGTPGPHELVHAVGTEEVDFIVYSLKASLPDTICLSPVSEGATASSGNQTATVFPDLGTGTYEWTVLSGPVTITNGNAKTAGLSLADNNAIGQVELKFTIEGVTYTTTAFVKSCECSCQPVTSGATFGAIALTFSAPPTSSAPDGEGFCSYTASNATISNLEMVGQFTKSSSYQGVQLSYKKNCQTGAYKDVTISWSGEKDLGQMSFVKVKAKGFSLTVDASGNLHGTVNLSASTDADVDLTGNGIIKLKQGVTGDFSFAFSGGQNFNGSFNFQGISNIDVDIKKGNTIIAQFSDGALQADGTLSGTISGLSGAEYESNAFKVKVDNLSLSFNFNLIDGSFEPQTGSGAVSISDIKAINGSATLGLDINQSNINATISNTTFTAFGMSFEDFNVNAVFNFNFDMVEFDGSLKAKHTDFDVSCAISEFRVENGELRTFAGASSVKYKGFTFNLQTIQYQSSPSSLSISAQAEINLAVQASLGVDKFTIDEAGTISIGKINGSVTKSPVSISFNAEFMTNRFKGSFSADFAAAGPINGAVDIGSEPTFNFGYFSITAGVNLPLGQTGLKISQIGGSFGFNYDLAGGGNPQSGTYVFGGTLGVADVANLCEVVGGVTVQLGGSSVQVSLSGTVNVLKNNTFFSSNITANYKYPQNTLSGAVTTSFSIPSSGWMLNANNVGVNYHVGNGQWSANGANMSASMFNGFIALTGGTVNMNGSTSNPLAVLGSVGGNASIGYNWSGTTEVFGQSFTAAAQFTMNSPVNVGFNQNGLSGSLAVNMSAGGNLNWSTIIGSGAVGFTSTCNGSVSYGAAGLNLSGNLNVPLPFTMCLPSSIYYPWIWDYCFDSLNFGVNVTL